MIRLFGSSDSSFTSNGDKILTPLKCEIYESDKIGEDYSVDMDLPISEQEYIEENRIVAIDTPNKGNQLFRINKIDKKNPSKKSSADFCLKELKQEIKE